MTSRYRALLERDSRIENVSIGGYEEEFGLFQVTTVAFTIRDKSDSFVVLFVPNGEAHLQSLSMYQMGSISPVLLEWDELAGAWAPRCPSLASDSEHTPPDLPCRIENPSEIVSHYDDLIGYFQKWPTFPEYRTFTSSDGKVFRYYVEPVGVNTKDAFIPGF